MAEESSMQLNLTTNYDNEEKKKKRKVVVRLRAFVDFIFDMCQNLSNSSNYKRGLFKNRKIQLLVRVF